MTNKLDEINKLLDKYEKLHQSSSYYRNDYYAGAIDALEEAINILEEENQ